ncbi:MAG: hypothetical protein GY940_10615 [bacterium]|nr:hypothetical protein [bacterium]
MQPAEIKDTFSSDVAPQFDKTLLGPIQRPIDPEMWSRVEELYEKKQYKEVILGIMEYVDRSLIQRTGNSDRTKFVIPHGSAIVNLEIGEELFYVNAPFLIVPPTRNIPLLRQVAQINLFPLNLSTIVLEDDRLIFKYHCPLELCEPFKVYNVLREICAYSDAYDDEFIKQFKARRVHEPVIKHYSREFLEKSRKQVSLYLNETIRYVEYFEKKRLPEICVDLITTTLMKIDYYIAPQGVMRTDIEKTVSQLQDQETPLMDKVRKGMERLDHLKKCDENEFSRDLYIAEIFIPLKFNFTAEMIESYFQVFYEAAQKEVANRDHIGAVLTMQTAFLNLFYHYIFPDDIKDTIIDAMTKSGGKPWDKASATLWAALSQVLAHEKPTRKKGFWRSLLGSKK